METTDPMAAPPNPSAYPVTGQQRTGVNGEWDQQWEPGMTLLDAAALAYAPAALDAMVAIDTKQGHVHNHDAVVKASVGLAWELAQTWLAERNRRQP